MKNFALGRYLKCKKCSTYFKYASAFLILNASDLITRKTAGRILPRKALSELRLSRYPASADQREDCRKRLPSAVCQKNTFLRQNDRRFLPDCRWLPWLQQSCRSDPAGPFLCLCSSRCLDSKPSGCSYPNRSHISWKYR